VDRPARLRPRELDRPDGRGARPSHVEHQRDRRRAGEGPARPVADGRGRRPFVRLRCRLRSGAGAAGARGMPGSDPRPFASGPLLLRRSDRATCPNRPVASPRPQVRLQGPEHLAAALRRARLRGRRLRDSAGARLGRVAPQGSSPRGPWQPWPHADRGRDAGVGGGGEAAAWREAARTAGALWLWWHGPEEAAAPELDLLWRAYARRFDLEHTFRFLKQTLGWSTPRVRHPEQADRWTWLVLIAYTQLRLARSCVADRRLPWERCYAPGHLTPYRVRRGVLALLPTLGTPAKPPKPCGRSPGRPKGRRSGRAKRYPALKKAA